MPVMRFDYAGTGDSGDIDEGSDQVLLWQRNIAAAVAELQRRTGVARVCLLGLRLGALLAARAVAHCPQVDGLIAIAPVVQGRRYLRELRTARLAAQPVEAQRDPESALPTGALQSQGAVLSAASVASLSEMDLLGSPLPVLDRWLIIDRTDLPNAAPLQARLEACGAQTRYRALPGFVEMALTAPHLGALPEAMLAEVCRWLESEPGARDSADTRPLVQDAAAVMQIEEPGSGARPLTERAVYLQNDPALFGILSVPAPGEARSRAVILLNSAADHHVGPSRLYVSLARRWARHGYVVLRMDLAGLGDSGTRAGHAPNEVFPREAIEDIRAAIDYLRANHASREITIGGLCSGAYHALQAGIAALPVQRILMINPRTYVWREGMKIDDVQLWEVAQFPSIYRGRILSAGYWARLLRGQVRIGRVLSIYCHRTWLAIEPRLRDAARSLHIHLSDDVGWELERMAARGVRVVLVFARGDGGDELLRLLAHASLQRLGARCRVHVIDGSDHGFSRAGPREQLVKVLSDELFARVDG